MTWCSGEMIACARRPVNVLICHFYDFSCSLAKPKMPSELISQSGHVGDHLLAFLISATRDAEIRIRKIPETDTEPIRDQEEIM